MAENFSGLITIDTGAAEDVLIGQHPSSTTFSTLGLNGSMAEGVSSGLSGGGNTTLYVNAGNAGDINFRSGNGSSYSTLLHLKSNGLVGIGTSDESGNGLHIASATSDAQNLVLQQTTNSDGQSANIAFYDYGDTNVAMIRGANISQASHHGALKFYTNAGSGNAQRAIIDKDGNVGIGTGSPGYNLEIKGQFYAGGSSIDYKKHVTDLDVDSSLIHSLRPVSYNYKKEYKDFGYNVKDGKQIGLVSEEVAKTIPELAIMKDGKPKNVDYQKLAVVLLAEVQSLKKDIEELKKDN